MSDGCPYISGPACVNCDGSCWEPQRPEPPGPTIEDYCGSDAVPAADPDETGQGQRRAVTLAEIDEQRAKGWPDFHPEDYCHRCGHRNVESWAVGRGEWLEAGIDGRWQEIICPQCFTEQWREATGENVTWLLSRTNEHAAIARIEALCDDYSDADWPILADLRAALAPDEARP